MCAFTLTARIAPAQQDSWQANWLLEDGFSIEIDSEGYRFPTAIAFVPNPGEAPDDPLYFITELGGTIKVVTNDRTVHTFADDVVDRTPEPLPVGESGMAGIELDPENGYVFVSFVYPDEGGVLRNNIVRFDSEPQTFSLEPRGRTLFTDVFDDHFSTMSHQIGPMEVADGVLFVGVGDGHRSFDSRNIDAINGKVLRMSLDGRPLPDNPFYVDDDVNRARNYVWAYGFRNPFGLKVVGDRVFVADNGLSIDRFVEVHRGEDYLWDGSDWGIGSKADVFFNPAVGPVELTWLDPGNDVLPENYRSKFYLALGGPESERRSRVWSNGVVKFDYDFDTSQIVERPQHFVQYRGRAPQTPVGVQFGPDGVYVVPLHPLSNGVSAILKVRYTPDSPHPHTITRSEDVVSMMANKGCYGCHGVDVGDVRPGPPFDESLVPRISRRLRSDEYLAQVSEIDALESELHQRFSEERDTVLSARGVNQVRTWIKYRLMEPTFDRRSSLMPNPQLTETQAEAIANYLVGSAPAGALAVAADSPLRAAARRIVNTLEGMSPAPQYATPFAAGVLGAIMGGVGVLVLVGLIMLVRRWRRRRRELHDLRHVATMFAIGVGLMAGTADAQQDSWQRDWVVEEGFSISIDTEGYDYPSAIAFVPNPGSEPDSPLYFVTELGGSVKVVTNDRTVYTFVEDIVDLTPEAAFVGESGMAGIELDPEHGYVFVSYLYQDAAGILRNNIVRFESTPQSFSLEPTGRTFFTDVFANYYAAMTHQVGPMVVDGDHLYVSVGDGWRPFDSRNLDTVNGKILRMTLGGQPVRSNPFFVDDGVSAARDYVWAYGLRNPFGLTMVNGRLFAADNGLEVDRFVEVIAGEDYLWDGSDWSIGTRAALTFTPSVGPVELSWFPADNTVLPEQYRSRFFLALGGTESPVLETNSTRGVVMFEYDMEKSQVVDPPRYILRHRSSEAQQPIGVQWGPDGIYVVPLRPLSEGRFGILRVSYAPESPHPYTLQQEGSAARVMTDKGCFACHGRNPTDVRPGPSFDRNLVPRISERLRSAEYLESVRAIDELDGEPFRSFTEERDSVLAASGLEQVRRWIKYRLMEPRFDQQTSSMPNPNITEHEAELIAEYLVETTPDAIGRSQINEGSIKALARRIVNTIEGLSPYPAYAKQFAAAVFGAVAGGIAVLLPVVLVLAIRRRRRSMATARA